MLSSAAHGLSVYGACATMGPIPFSAAKALYAAISFMSSGFAAPPRGLRVKNWNVFAPIDSASRPIAR